GLWGGLEAEAAPPERRFRAGQALAAYAAVTTAPERWRDQASFLAGRLTAAVLTNQGHYAALAEAFRPAREALIPPLRAAFHQQKGAELERLTATNLLIDYLGDRPEELAALVKDAEPYQFGPLLQKLREHRE